MKKKLIACVLVMGISFSLTGCFAGWGNTKAVEGGYFTSNTGDYIVLNESGGQIMDCWILNNTYVDSEHASDGLRFVDANGNGIKVQGDAKIIRVNSKVDVSQYIDYHIERDLIPYSEYYKQHNAVK